MKPNQETGNWELGTGNPRAARPSAALVQQLLLTKQAEELLGAFAERSIPAILLKGTAFWTSIYQPGERPVSDIDILVREQDLDRAGAVFEDLNYDRHLTDNRPATMRSFYNHGYMPRNRHGRTAVELHRCLTHPIRYDIDVPGLFDRAEPCTLGRAPALRLSPEDSLLHLAIHRSVHSGGFDEDPRNHEDAHRIIAQRDVDWDALISRAARWGCATVTWIMFDSIAHRHGTPVPPEVLHRLLPGRPRQQYLHRMFRRANGAWALRRQDLPGWQRRLAVFPLQLDRPDQFARSAWFYGRTRLQDLLESLS